MAETVSRVMVIFVCFCLRIESAYVINNGKGSSVTAKQGCTVQVQAIYLIAQVLEQVSVSSWAGKIYGLDQSAGNCKYCCQLS